MLKRRIVQRSSGRMYNNNITFDILKQELSKIHQKFLFHLINDSTLEELDSDLSELTSKYELDLYPLLTDSGKAIKGFKPAEYVFPDGNSGDPVSLSVEFDFEDHLDDDD